MRFIGIILACLLAGLSADALAGVRVVVDAHIECWQNPEGGVSYDANSQAEAMDLAEEHENWILRAVGDVRGLDKALGSVGVHPRNGSCNNQGIVKPGKTAASVSCDAAGTDGRCDERLRFRVEATLFNPFNSLSLAFGGADFGDCCAECKPPGGGFGDPFNPFATDPRRAQ